MLNIDAKGVYLIRNTVSGAVYVGSTGSSFRQRWHEHRSALRRGVHANIHLQRSWLKYGEGAFIFEILVVCSHNEDIPDCERAWLTWLFTSVPARKRCNRYPDPSGPI